MTRIAYLNGEYLPLEEAKVSVLDRGFLFADGIYEVTAVIDGRLVDNDGHLARLQRSLNEISLKSPVSMEELTQIQLEVGRRSEMKEGLIYWQITRGADKIRDFGFPDESVKSTLMMFAQPKNILGSQQAKDGASACTVEDIRWKRRDIKSVALLGQVIAKQQAVEKGCYEAFMVEDGYVTEGSSSTAFIIKDNTLITRPLSNKILAGITRQAVLQLAKEADLKIEERLYSVEELYQADEVMLTSASSLVMPIVKVDDHIYGNGAPGSLSLRLRELYIDLAMKCEPRIEF